MAGKGDHYRPVNQKLWEENYDRIFGSKTKNKARTNATDNEKPCSKVHGDQAVSKPCCNRADCGGSNQ